MSNVNKKYLDYKGLEYYTGKVVSKQGATMNGPFGEDQGGFRADGVYASTQYYWNGAGGLTEIASMQGPTGPTGPTGPQGPQGPNPEITLQEVIAELEDDSNDPE